MLDRSGQHVTRVVALVPSLSRKTAAREVGIMAVRRTARRQRENLEARGQGMARRGGIEMHTDKNRTVPDFVAHPRTGLQRDELVATARDHHPQTRGLQMRADAPAEVEVVIFFRAPTIDRTAVMTTVPGI